jgi:chemotaxis protein methyltransferase CheR
LTSLDAVRDLIETRCGLRFDDSQRSSLSSAVAARMQQLDLQCPAEYLARLKPTTRSVEAELRNLLNLVTVTETCFFRDVSQFQLLRDHMIPSLMRQDSAGPLRIWSAGCSSGEEAYSIALTADDMGLFQPQAGRTIEIVGTDLNTMALKKAQQGVYSSRAVRNVDGRLLEKYFRRDANSFVVNDDLRNRVTFEFGNLTQTPMPSNGPQHIIFCKNVSIYFSAEVTRKLVRGLYDTLVPGGYLLLGHAESLWQMSDGFDLVEYERAFCYRKAERSASRAKAALPAAVKATVDPNPEDTYLLCVAAFRAGDWDGVEARLTALIASCPTFVPAYLLLGGVYAHRSRYDEAVTQAELVLKLTDLEPRAHLLLGMIAARRKRADDAMQSLRRALYLDDSLALAHFWLGNLYRERGDVARACQEYQNVVRGWERHTLELTEEFASDLTAEQLVGFCRHYVGTGLTRV